MITTLYVGMVVVLPSGNRLVLLHRQGKDWQCAYAPGAKLRGEVELSGAYLRRWAIKFA